MKALLGSITNIHCRALSRGRGVAGSSRNSRDGETFPVARTPELAGPKCAATTSVIRRRRLCSSRLQSSSADSVQYWGGPDESVTWRTNQYTRGHAWI